MKTSQKNPSNLFSRLMKLCSIVLAFCLLSLLFGCGGQGGSKNIINESSGERISKNERVGADDNMENSSDNPEVNGEIYQDYSGATEAFHMDESDFMASIAKKAILSLNYGKDITLGHLDMFLAGNDWINNSTWTYDSDNDFTYWEFNASGEIFNDSDLELKYVAQGDFLRLGVRRDADDDVILSRIWKNDTELVGMDDYYLENELANLYDYFGGVTTDGEEYWSNWHEDRTAKRPYPEIRFISDLISASFDESVALLGEIYKYDSDEGIVFERPYYDPNYKAYILEIYTDTTKQLVATFYDYTSEEVASSTAQMIVDEVHITHNLFFLIPLQLNGEFSSRLAKEDIPCLITPAKIDFDGTSYYLNYDWYYIRLYYSTGSPSMTDHAISYPENIEIVRK